jgi:hypothetical protein
MKQGAEEVAARRRQTRCPTPPPRRNGEEAIVTWEEEELVADAMGPIKRGEPTSCSRGSANARERSL